MQLSIFKTFGCGRKGENRVLRRREKTEEMEGDEWKNYTGCLIYFFVGLSEKVKTNIPPKTGSVVP
jgi:hypothetical protein